MKTVSIVEANNQLAELLYYSASEQLPILLTEDGEVKGVLLNIKIFEALVHSWTYKNRDLMSLNELQVKLKAKCFVSANCLLEQIGMGTCALKNDFLSGFFIDE